MKRSRGQGLLEFALVMPILLLLLFGIFDFSRVLVTYAMASNSLRSGLRQAAVLGYDESQAQFADCEHMRDIIRQTFFVAAPTIAIQYEKSATGSIIPCTGSSINSNLLTNGDLLQISVSTNIQLLTPFLSNAIPNLQINMRGQRTIVNFIELTNQYMTDTDFDGLADAWEIANFGNINGTGTDDPDLDRCNNGCEETRGTNPNVADTDGDGLQDGAEVYVYFTNPSVQDTDGDGLTDGYEVNVCGTAPASVDGVPPDSRDTDSDGVPDNVECGWGAFVPGPDYDGDGLSDSEEIARGTDPTRPDTDGDTLTDGDEVNIYRTNPLLRDSDGDGLDDNVELGLAIDPNAQDSDGDGLTDGEEVNTYGTNPLNADSDGDNLGDGFEVAPKALQDQTDALRRDTDSDGLDDDKEIYVHLTKPNVADTDGDTVNDGDEVHGGTALPSPCGLLVGRPATNPLVADTDGDGIPDDQDCSPAGANDDGDALPDPWEIGYYGDIYLYDETSDPDIDGCNNGCEYQRGTNPVVADTDGDDLTDGDEIARGTNPLRSDTDNDGLTDGQEVAGMHPTAGAFSPSNPVLANSDTDNLSDGEEVLGQHPWGTPHGLGSSNPTLWDTDGDGLSDSLEVTPNPQMLIMVVGQAAYPVPATFPGNADSDGDGISDGIEVTGIPRTNPRVVDTDGDGVNDKAEQDGNGSLLITVVRVDSTCATTTPSIAVPPTNPLNGDSDGDGISDGNEINRQVAGSPRPTNPAAADTDLDGIWDSVELAGNSARLIQVFGAQPYGVPATDPTDDDSDNDCLRDGAEINRTAGTPAVAAATDPTKADTDNDGLNDRAEGLGNATYFIRVNGAAPGYSVPATDPLKSDTDGDTLSDSAEVNRTAGTPAVSAPTDPTRADTDSDTVNDNLDSDPLNAPPPILRIAGATVAEPGSGSTTVDFPITLLYPRAGQTVQVTATTSNGTAIAGVCKNNGEDFVASSQTLTFTPGTTTRYFQVTVCADNKK